MAPVFQMLPEEWQGWAANLGWLAAFLECALGVGLLVWPLRLRRCRSWCSCTPRSWCA